MMLRLCMLVISVLLGTPSYAEPDGLTWDSFLSQDSIKKMGGLPVQQLACSPNSSETNDGGAGYIYSNTALTEVSRNTVKTYYRIKAISDVRFVAMSDQDQQEFLTNESFKRIAQKTGCECKSTSDPGCSHGGPYHQDMYVAKVSQPKVVQCWAWNYVQSPKSLTGQNVMVEVPADRRGIYIVCKKTGLQGKTGMPSEPYDEYVGLRAAKKICEKCDDPKENTPGVEVYDTKEYNDMLKADGLTRIPPLKTAP